MATSFKNDFESEAKQENKTAVELYMLSDIIIEYTEHFAKGLKDHLEGMDQDDNMDGSSNVVKSYEEFAKFLLQNSFSSDHHCRYQSQKVLYSLASKFFTEITEVEEENLPKWIMNLINECNLMVNKRIDDFQLKILEAIDDNSQNLNLDKIAESSK